MSRGTWTRHVRLITVGALVAAGLQFVLPATSNADSMDPPSGLTESTGPSIPTLSWDRASGATSYQVQASTSVGFGTTAFSATTSNTQYVPTSPLPAGTVFWRVRAKYAAGYSDYSDDSFTAGNPPVPTLLSPADDSSDEVDGDAQALVAPETPLIMHWSNVQGAVKYDVQVSDDPTFNRITLQKTSQTTSLSTPIALLPDGRYYWRVQAEWANLVVSGYNAQPFSFWISSHADVASAPVAPTAADGNEPVVKDVALSWHPVPGAATYTVQVSTDSQFLDSSANVATVSGVRGTRYSPAITFNNDQYFWRVQGIDASGNPLGWSTTWQFQRNWPDSFGTTYPADSGVAEDPTTITDPRQMFFQWSPVRHASSYNLVVSSDPSFAGGSTQTCTTTNTTLSLTYAGTGANSKACSLKPNLQYWWFVAAVDASTVANGPVTQPDVSPVHTFVYQPTTALTGGLGSITSGVTASLSGTGLTSSNPSDTCDPMQIPQGCQNLPSTPVLSWPAQKGAGVYLVQVYHDQKMTNIYSAYSQYVQAPVWAEPVEFADSQAGQAYFVHITACSSAPCGATTDLTDANIGFNITSDPVELCDVTTDHGTPTDRGLFCDTSSNTNTGAPGATTMTTDDNVTFDWSDYLDTTQAAAPDATVTGGPGTEARYYRIQVATSPSFVTGSILDDAKVDQTTFTSLSNTYPDGPIYWRVQAYDGNENPLAWSDIASFTKASTGPTPTSPTDGASAGANPTLTWNASDNTASYDVEVYKDDGNPLGTSNRVLSATTVQTAWAMTNPLTPGKSYLWRVARVDTKGRVSPWSAVQHFTTASASIDTIAPSDGATLSPLTLSFTWNAVPGAASYLFSMTSSTGATTTQTTSALSWAPLTMPANGTTSSWCVIPLDAAGNQMTACPASQPTFTYISAPTATALKVEGNPAVAATLTAQTPAWNVADVTTSYQWYLNSVTPANAILGATDTTYRPVASDLGKKVIAVATGTKAGYDSGTTTSSALTVVAGAAPTLTPALSLTGAPTVGNVLAPNAFSWVQPGVTTSYQWFRDDTKIVGATKSSYLLTSADYQHSVKLQVTGTLTGYSPEIVDSPAVVVTAGSALVAQIKPSFSGSALFGRSLFVQNGTWSRTPSAYTYQWLRDGKAISGATRSSYAIALSDIGHRISARVTAILSGYSSGTATTTALTVPKIGSTVQALFQPTLIKARHRGKVVAVVRASGVPGPTGTVKVYVDGHLKVSGSLSTSAKGQKTLTLPALRKGKHKVYVSYGGDSHVSSSRSSTATLTQS